MKLVLRNASDSSKRFSQLFHGVMCKVSASVHFVDLFDQKCAVCPFSSRVVQMDNFYQKLEVEGFSKVFDVFRRALTIGKSNFIASNQTFLMGKILVLFSYLKLTSGKNCHILYKRISIWIKCKKCLKQGKSVKTNKTFDESKFGQLFWSKVKN